MQATINKALTMVLRTLLISLPPDSISAIPAGCLFWQGPENIIY